MQTGATSEQATPSLTHNTPNPAKTLDWARFTQVYIGFIYLSKHFIFMRPNHFKCAMAPNYSLV